MEFNLFKKGYSACKQFEYKGLYVSFGRCCGHDDNSSMAIVSIDKPKLYVVGGEVFRAKLNDILHKECSEKEKRALFEHEAFKVVSKELKKPSVFKRFVAEIADNAFKSGVETAKSEFRRALGLGG